MNKKEIKALKEENEKLQQELVDLQQYIITLENSDDDGMKKFEIYDSNYVRGRTMPKEMSDWFDLQINNGDYAVVNGHGKKSYAMKSDNCTVILVPNWNCNRQFASVVNDLRQKKLEIGTKFWYEN